MSDPKPLPGPVSYVAMRNGQPTNTALTLEVAQTEALRAEQLNDGDRYDYRWVEEKTGDWRLMRKLKARRPLPAERTARTVAAVPMLPGPPVSPQPQLSLRLDATWLHGILRADQIRHDTLVSLVATWGDPDARDDILAQLDALAEAVQSLREGELDALLEAVEGAAGMDDAEIRVDLHTLLRLRAELDDVIEKRGRFNPAAVARPIVLPRQQDRRAS